jgi:chromosome segregation ATPase
MKMKRDFLKNLGIEDKDIIDKILDENSADIGRAKGELDTYKNKVTGLENDIKTKDATIATLQSKADSVDGLNQKISQLETDKTNLTNELNTKVSKIQKDHAIEGRIRDRKGRNIKAIKALLDEDKITFEDNTLGGIDEQLDALESAEDSSMLFGEAQVATPSGTHLNNPPAGGNGGNPPTSKTFAEAVAKAIGKN